MTNGEHKAKTGRSGSKRIRLSTELGRPEDVELFCDEGEVFVAGGEGEGGKLETRSWKLERGRARRREN